MPSFFFHRLSCVLGLSALILLGDSLGAQNPQVAFRPPAVPLVAHDPYFSVWSMGDHVTDLPTKHWSGVNQDLYGIVRVDGKNYRFLGATPRHRNEQPALEQASEQITPTRTIVVMTSPEIELQLEFLTPLLPDDLALMARPVTYLTWRVHSRDGRQHAITLYLDAAGTLATNDPGEPVEWSRAVIPELNLLRIGTRQQAVLGRYGDNVRIDWGWFYLGVPQAEQQSIAAGNQEDRARFVVSGALPQTDDIDEIRAPQSHHPPAPVLSIALPLGSVGSVAVERHILLAYDDVYPIEYMHRKLLPYWRREFATFGEMLEAAEKDYPALEARTVRFDEELQNDLAHAGGPEYARIAILAYQQAIAAHKLVEDEGGHVFFMPKENFSNGSISTVDVIYPSAPMFLLLNPKLAEAQLDPVLRYAQMPQWKFPFAPHDLGVYPLADGQQYGGGEVSEDNQMPVEESGDMLLSVAAIAHAEKNAAYPGQYWDLLSKWAEYLLSKGLNPDNQLCTDDFAGHLAHNANLSIKAIEALGAYAQLAAQLHHDDVAARYRAAAEKMAKQWVAMAADGDHYRLAFDQPGTWSQKDNLVWDRILGLQLFPPELAAREIAFYRTRMAPYGLPLDNRASYTKLDWEIWTATLATSDSDFQMLVHAVYRFLNETPDRVPMADWYDTVSARQEHFQARSVVGGIYIKALADPALWNKWAERGEQASPVVPPAARVASR